MIDKNYTIRIATRTEVDIAIELAAKEGWNPGLHDADCYYSAALRNIDSNVKAANVQPRSAKHYR